MEGLIWQITLERQLHIKITMKTNINHDVHHGCVKMEADVGETDIEDFTPKRRCT